jgi:hypothetical protein
MGLMFMLRGARVQALQAEQTQPPPEALPAPSQPPTGQETDAQPEPGGTELLYVLVGQQLEVSSPSPIKRMSVSSPGIIDTTLENSNQIRIDGKAPGGVSLVVEDETGQTQIFYVEVNLKETSSSAQLPEALPDNPVPAQVQKKKTAWLGWVVVVSIVLLAFFKVWRQREPYKLDLRSPKLVPRDSSNEPALSPPGSAHPEKASTFETVVHAARMQAGNLESLNQEVVEQWWRQFKKEAEAAMAGLREEIKNTGKVLEESRRLAEVKMASFWEGTQEQFNLQMVLALREHAHEMHKATAAEMESIKKATGEAMAQLEAAEEKRETSLAARTGEAEERLAGVSVALEAVEGRLKALVEGFEGRIESGLQALQGRVEKQAEDLEKLAQELGGRWSEQFQKQAEASLEKLREEANQERRAAEESQRESAGMFEAKLQSFNEAVASATAGLAAEQKEWAEESQRQLSSIVQAKVESLSQFALNITTSLQAEHTRLRNEYQTSQREFENLASRGPRTAFFFPFQHENRRKWRGIVLRLAMATGILLAFTVSVLAIYLWTIPVMQLQAQPPAEFIDESPNWGPIRRGREQEVAQAYWQAAVANLQEKYPFGSELPTKPPSEFDAGKMYLPAGGAKSLSETRDHYWQKLRKIWVQRDSWVETSEWDAQWASRFKHFWGQSR